MNHCLNCGQPAKNKYCSIKCCNQHQSTIKIKNLLTKKVREKATQTRKNKWKTFIINCYICNKEINIKEYNVDKPKKEKYYCSRKCANTHIFSEQTRKKISNSLIKETDNKWINTQTKICEECKNEFQTIYKNKKFCSNGCKRKSNHTHRPQSFKEKIRLSVLNQYKDGKKVYGGTTKWYNYNGIKVQGTYELRTCFILDKWKEIGKIKDWKYTNDRIKYIGIDNKEHLYLLDFKIFENDNSFYYLETKGYEIPNDKFKWNAVKEKGIKLEIWFNNDISKNEKW